MKVSIAAAFGLLLFAGASTLTAQDPLPSPFIPFADMSARGNIDYPDEVEGDGSVRLDVEITTSPESDGLFPAEESVFLHIEPFAPIADLPSPPRHIVAVPKGCLLPKGAGFALDDPKTCGFQWLVQLESGKMFDITPHVSVARMRFQESFDGTWTLQVRLVVTATEAAALPSPPRSVTATIGNESGLVSISSKVRWVSCRYRPPSSEP